MKEYKCNTQTNEKISAYECESGYKEFAIVYSHGDVKVGSVLLDIHDAISLRDQLNMFID